MGRTGRETAMKRKAGAASSDYRPGGRPFTGRRFLLVIVAFFAVIFAANGAMTWFALTNFRGVVVNSSFVASQDFNADKARADAQAARGWRATVAAPQGAPVLSLRDRDGAPLAGLRVTARALRPLDVHLDRDLGLREAGPGDYAAAEPLPPGQWRIAFAVEGAGERYAASLPLMVETR